MAGDWMRNKRACLVGSLHLSLAGNVPLTGLSVSCSTPLDTQSTWHTLPCSSASSSFLWFILQRCQYRGLRRVFCAMIGRVINWKGFGRKRSWSCQGTIQEFSRSDWEKPRKFSVRIAGVVTGIRNRHLTCDSVECCRYAVPFGTDIS